MEMKKEEGDLTIKLVTIIFFGSCILEIGLA